VTLHYTFGVSYTGLGTTSRIFYQAINDDKFIRNVNKTSSLFAFINAVDTVNSGVYVQCRNSSTATPDAAFEVPEVYLGYTWIQMSDSSKGECMVWDTNKADKVKLADYTPLTIKNNGLYVFLIQGSIANKAIFPVKVSILGSAATSGATTAVVSVALMALLAILAFATPALF